MRINWDDLAMENPSFLSSSNWGRSRAMYKYCNNAGMHSIKVQWVFQIVKVKGG